MLSSGIPTPRSLNARFVTLLAMALAALMLVVACGGSSSSSGSSGGGNGGGTGDGGSDPGADFTGRTEEFAMTEAELVAKIEAVEERIGACMQEAGFEYVPLDATTVRDAMDSLGTLVGVPDEDFVAQFGYGISTVFDEPGEMIIFGDQNIRILESLSEGDQVAYLRTLLGEDTEATFVLTLDDEDFEPIGGCTRTAVEAEFSADVVSGRFGNPFDVAVENDPRMIAAREDWARCMREEGYDYDRQEDAEDEIAERFEEIVGDEDPESLTGPALAELRELQGEERAVAARDDECSVEFLDDVEDAIEEELSGVV